MELDKVKIHKILKKYWGFPSFRPLQEEVIESVLLGRDTLALMPTGGGKSLCFQLPALYQKGLCLVITPLISLMKDQVFHLGKKGIPALAIHSGMPYREVKAAFDNALYGPYKFLYLSPERLQTDLFQDYIEALPINLITVDEAHCISQWGFDFRPSYLKIGEIREVLPNIPVLAITATATLDVQKDIQKQLLFKKKNVLVKSFFRKNLSYSVFNEENKLAKLERILKKVAGSSIIFCRTRRKTEEVSRFLLAAGFKADFYHAGLPAEERNEKQEQWIDGLTRVIVCTNAFGMGIDKANVRTVIHFDVPESPEAYYQQAGRVGRDGKRAYAVLLYNEKELEDLGKGAALKYPTLKKIREIYHDVVSYLQIPAGVGKDKYYSFDLEEFCDRFEQDRKEVLPILRILEQENHLYFTEKIYLPPRVHFTSTKEELNFFEAHNPVYTPLLKDLLRSYQGIFFDFVPISERQIAKDLKIRIREVVQKLRRLETFGILEYEKSNDLPQIFFPDDRMIVRDLPIRMKEIKSREKAHEKRIQAIQQYAQNRTRCRSRVLLEYFNETDSPDCGICDVCLTQKRKQNRLSDQHINSLKEKILQAPKTVKHLLSEYSTLQQPEIENLLRKLLDEEKIEIQEGNVISWIGNNTN